MTDEEWLDRAREALSKGDSVFYIAADGLRVVRGSKGIVTRLLADMGIRDGEA